MIASFFRLSSPSKSSSPKMDVPHEVDDYIKETIQDSMGLPVSAHTLLLKLRATEDSNRRLRDQHRLLLEKLRRKDQLIDCSKAEASMNAAALKKFVEENQRLAEECANLVSQCDKWERECSLYDHDREALMEFGNEADERAKEAELRVCELEKELVKVSEELQFYKQENQMLRTVDKPVESTNMEDNLLESILLPLIGEDEGEYGRAFLEANSEYESSQELLKMWSSLGPLSQKVLSLAAKVETLQKDKEHLRINLSRAEEEVKLLFEENKILDEENKKLMSQHQREHYLDGSDCKHTSSGSTKRSKRKSSPKTNSPVERSIDFKDVDLVRQPLSPLQHNSPDCRMHKR